MTALAEEFSSTSGVRADVHLPGLESEPGSGATLYVHVPLAKPRPS